VNIGTVRQLGRHQEVPTPVAREKCHLAAAERTKGVCIGWLAERRIERHLVHIGQARHGIQATPADDSNLRLQRIHLKDGMQTIDYTKRKCKILPDGAPSNGRVKDVSQ